MKTIRIIGITLLPAAAALTFFGISGSLPVWTILAGAAVAVAAIIMIWPKQLQWLVINVIDNSI